MCVSNVLECLLYMQRWIQLYRSNSRHLDHVRVTYVRPAPTEVPQVDEHDESRIAVSNYATLLHLDGVAGKACYMHSDLTSVVNAMLPRCVCHASHPTASA